jgi:hypothetical protein
MTSINAGKRIGLGIVLLAVTALAGCATPRSVAPLLRVTERALIEASQRLAEDAERDREYARQTLGSLENAYRQDLEGTRELTPAWVLEATAVYVAAREAVLEHQQALATERDIRADNLRAAASATRRAIVLTEQQDGVLRGVVGDELAELLNRLDRTR